LTLLVGEVVLGAAGRLSLAGRITASGCSLTCLCGLPFWFWMQTPLLATAAPWALLSESDLLSLALTLSSTPELLWRFGEREEASLAKEPWPV